MQAFIFGLARRFVSPDSLRRFALWALRGLEEQLDPETKARLEQYRRDRATTEASIAAEKQAIEEASAKLAQLETQRSEVKQAISDCEIRIANLKAEKEKIKNEKSQVADLSDDDVLHRDVRRG